MENLRGDFPPPAWRLGDGNRVLSWAERGCGGMGSATNRPVMAGRERPRPDVCEGPEKCGPMRILRGVIACSRSVSPSPLSLTRLLTLPPRIYNRVVPARGQMQDGMYLVEAAFLEFTSAAAWAGGVPANLLCSVASPHQCIKSLIGRHWRLHPFRLLIHVLVLHPRKD